MNDLFNFKKNLILGKLVLIISYFTLALYPAAIFFGAKLHKMGIYGKSIYLISGFLSVMILVSGILFLVSLFLNIQESRKINHISSGLKLTFISIAPVLLCYAAIIIKVLSEGH